MENQCFNQMPCGDVGGGDVTLSTSGIQGVCGPPGPEPAWGHGVAVQSQLCWARSKQCSWCFYVWANASVLSWNIFAFFFFNGKMWSWSFVNSLHIRGKCFLWVGLFKWIRWIHLSLYFFFLLFPTRKKSHVHCFERWHRFSSVCPFRWTGKLWWFSSVPSLNK